MNERDVPDFDHEGIERVLRSVNSNPNNLLSLDHRDINIISKAIIRYAALCGVITPQSTMK